MLQDAGTRIPDCRRPGHHKCESPCLFTYRRHLYNQELDLSAIAGVWNHGSVIRGWLLELTQRVLERDRNLESIRGTMNSSGEGKWTVETALELGVPAPVITMSLLMRYRSQQEDTFAGKVFAALRKEFGGHSVGPKK